MKNKKRLVAASAFVVGLAVVASCGVDPKLKISPLSGGVDSSIPMTFALTPAQITEICTTEIKTFNATIDKIAGGTPEAATLDEMTVDD